MIASILERMGDETYNRVMVGGREERDVNTEQKFLGTTCNWNYFTYEFLFKFQTRVEIEEHKV